MLRRAARTTIRAFYKKHLPGLGTGSGRVEVGKFGAATTGGADGLFVHHGGAAGADHQHRLPDGFVIQVD